MMNNKYNPVFFELLRAGLWEQRVLLSPYELIDFKTIYEIAEEQSVVGLLAAGIEHIGDLKLVKQDVMPFMKKVFSLEERNKAMNGFIGNLVERLRERGIYALLVKGQGVAQCYERPLWRSSGDVDLLLDKENYRKAKTLLMSKASSIDKEDPSRMHLGMSIDQWKLELHGSLRSSRLGRVNSCIDRVSEDTFRNGRVRVWKNGKVDVFIPCADNDLIFIFTHILQHYFAGGIGLRQICDWCRLMWCFRDEIDRSLLISRLKMVRLISEWQVFSSLAVNYLGMPQEAIPLYQKSTSLDRKARRLLAQILRSGNFGQNRDMSYLEKYPYLFRKIISFCKGIKGAIYRMTVFPLDSVVFFLRYSVSGAKTTMKGG